MPGGPTPTRAARWEARSNSRLRMSRGSACLATPSSPRSSSSANGRPWCGTGNQLRSLPWALVAKLGRIRSRTRGEDGAREFYLDFRPVGRVWSHRGIRITDAATAQRLLDRIRKEVAEGVSVEVVLPRYQPTDSPTILVPTWLGRWIALRRREADAGSLSPLYADELERLAAPGGHFAFFDRISIHEVSFGALEDWSLWLADR